jgi:hypothetical protein
MVRLSPLFIFLIIIMMYGVRNIGKYVRRFINNTIFYTCLTIALVLFGFYFIVRYTGIQTQKNELTYDTYIVKLMKYLSLQKDKEVYIRSITEGITYYSFVNKINPVIYQKKVKWTATDEKGFSHPSDLLNIHVTSKDILYVSCLSEKTGKKTLYVTNEKLPDSMGQPTQTIFSENNVYAYAMIYDVNAITVSSENCKGILKK